jgi:hypothetical protein
MTVPHAVQVPSSNWCEPESTDSEPPGVFIMSDVATNFDEPADLYPGGDRSHRVGYRRFKSLAAAVAYSVERLAGSQQVGATIETEEDRYEGAQIRELYRRADFPIHHRNPE